MSLLTFAKTALGSMVKQPVTVCYPQEKLAAPERLRGHIVNDMDVCICCGMCARRCPADALAVDRKGGTWSIDPYACVVCGECIESCPKLPDYGHCPYSSRSGQDSHGRNQTGVALEWGRWGKNAPPAPRLSARLCRREQNYAGLRGWIANLRPYRKLQKQNRR